MKRVRLLIGASLALTSVWALAQKAPESLLPPGFDKPAPRATRAATPAPAAIASSPTITALPVIQATSAAKAAAAGSDSAAAAAKLPSLPELESLSPDQLDELLGLKPKFDIPPAARRSMKQVGIIAASEGGLPSGMLAGQNASLVSAAITGNRGEMVSRWGHILLRRALASRLDAPVGMNPADFAAQRAALLLRMGEGDAARAIVQDVDGANYTPGLTQAAVDAYIATADITGICPVVEIQGGARKDPQWRVLRAICAAFTGDGASAMAQLDRATEQEILPKFDLLLAQKYAGVAGNARRAVTIEWDGVTDMNPLRYALTIGTGLEPPAELMRDAGARYDYTAATAPMLGLETRAAAADRAAGAGILSSAAMVDLYSQIFANEDVNGDWATRASLLRDAYVGDSPATRLAAMKQLWDGGSTPLQRYSRQVLTAYAAARIPVSSDQADEAAPLIASMLAAGLDGNAMRWANSVESGSEAWALLVLAAPGQGAQVSKDALDSFYSGDGSKDTRKSAFLLAGLVGLGKVSTETRGQFSSKLEIDLNRQSRWTRLIDQAADANNAALVSLLAGLGMQGDGWDRMTPRYLYHIVSALNRVGYSAEARMIAAEAVVRG